MSDAQGNLVKGERFNLTKGAAQAGTGNNFFVGLGWTAPAIVNGYKFDADVSFFGLNANGKLVSDKHFVYFSNLKGPANGVVEHSPDNLDGEDNANNIGDADEWGKFWLDRDPAVHEWSIVVCLYDARNRGQNFGQLSKGHVTVSTLGADGMPPLDAAGNPVPLEADGAKARFLLTDDYSKFTAMQVGSLYQREDGAWAFNATGVGFENAEIGDILKHYAD